jgi:hypothetical protein
MKEHLYMERVPYAARLAQSSDNVEALLRQKQKERGFEGDPSRIWLQAKKIRLK